MGCVLSTQPTIFDVSKCYQYSVILFYKNSNHALGGVRAVHVRDGGHSPLRSTYKFCWFCQECSHCHYYDYYYRCYYSVLVE